MSRGEGPGPYGPAVPELQPVPFLMEALHVGEAALLGWPVRGRVCLWTEEMGHGHLRIPSTPELPSWTCLNGQYSLPLALWPLAQTFSLD